MNEKLKKAITKCALGCSVSETVEEYSMEDGKMTLVKKKKNKKEIPPDLRAVQMLLEDKGESGCELSDEELEEERKRLISLLKEDV
ncbi:MAG: hypothetical protein J5993_01490 [Clostridia bacterium]|nr:hypothetical protein [Clostridia bacterium]